jgi:hypothetical protein
VRQCARHLDEVVAATFPDEAGDAAHARLTPDAVRRS